MAQGAPPTIDTVTIPVKEYAQLLRASEELKMAQPDFDIDGDLGDWDRFEIESLDSWLDETKPIVTPGSEDDFVAREHANHTVILLPPARITHAQVAAAVRGGPLIQIFRQRLSDQVNVTFARSEDATGFLAHTKSGPFYVGGHLVSLLTAECLCTTAEWAPRGYIAPKYVLQQAIAGTVSRNLVLENVHSKVTEAVIRRDLHHIHNMTIISVDFADGNAYISTSSVGGALYARTCMRSRAFYKSMRILFYEDECAKPFARNRRSRAVAPIIKGLKKPKNPIYNPFEVLSQGEFNFDENEEDESLEEL
ncbi:hypothetical protein F1880_003373 [Penicillium rolfsii]|nr:hypothetical protein F1880_003373 [Penicillium rolfsii]